MSEWKDDPDDQPSAEWKGGYSTGLLHGVLAATLLYLVCSYLVRHGG